LSARGGSSLESANREIGVPGSIKSPEKRSSSAMLREQVALREGSARILRAAWGKYKTPCPTRSPRPC